MDNNEVLTIIEAALKAEQAVDIQPLLIKIRNSCVKGPATQLAISNHDALNEYLQTLLLSNNEEQKQLKKFALQIIANAIVNNKETQQVMWSRHSETIINMCTTGILDHNTNVCLMIVYNILIASTDVVTEKEAFTIGVRVWHAVKEQKWSLEFEFLHFIFEHFLVVKGRETVRFYEQLVAEERPIFLDYLASYLTHDSPNGKVHSFILQYLAKQFKIKSDCVLRQTTDRLSEVQPREVHYLMRILASATGSEKYAELFNSDHALFLNVSSLLRCLVAAGKESTKSMFTPMAKLEEVALTSGISRGFEEEVSYEMKTLAVRCVANLLYKNSTNQGYCLDTQLMPALLECTNMDARNPLMKEWSILAIRNACIGCPEIQAVIANLTKVGEAPNDLLNELNLEMGALRINGSS